MMPSADIDSAKAKCEESAKLFSKYRGEKLLAPLRALRGKTLAELLEPLDVQFAITDGLRAGAIRQFTCLFERVGPEILDCMSRDGRPLPFLLLEGMVGYNIQLKRTELATKPKRTWLKRFLGVLFSKKAKEVKEADYKWLRAKGLAIEHLADLNKLLRKMEERNLLIFEERAPGGETLTDFADRLKKNHSKDKYIPVIADRIKLIANSPKLQQERLGAGQAAAY